MDLRPIAVERRVHSVAAPRKAQAPTAHASATLVFYTGGRARVKLDGDWEVGAGDLLLIPAGMRHRCVESLEVELWRLTFDVPCFAPSMAASLLEPLEQVRDGGVAVARIPLSRHGHLLSLFAELERIGPNAGDIVESVERSLLTLVLAEVAGVTSANRIRPADVGASSVVSRALRVIERRCLGPLGLAEVARAVDRSPAYVTTALTRATGRSVVQWIVGARMAEARRLLLHSDATVETITARVGYADPTHFIRMFRREHGVTPAAWRTAQVLSSSRRSR